MEAAEQLTTWTETFSGQAASLKKLANSSKIVSANLARDVLLENDYHSVIGKTGPMLSDAYNAVVVLRLW